MIGERFARMSAAFALIAGLIGMHGFVVGTHHTSGPAPVGSVAAPVHSATPAPMTAAHHATAPVDTSGALLDGRPTAGHDESPHPGSHRMLHLCLAVLAALLLLTAFVGLVWSLARLDAGSRGRIGDGRREPPRRPPPTSVRLAQLCVMRN